MTRLRRKLRGKRGESLTEVLASILVGGLAILLLAMAVTSAANINRQSGAALDAYYAANNAVVEGSGATESGTVTISDETPSHVSWSPRYDVGYSVAEQAGGASIVSYEESGASGGSVQP